MKHRRIILGSSDPEIQGEDTEHLETAEVVERYEREEPEDKRLSRTEETEENSTVPTQGLEPTTSAPVLDDTYTYILSRLADVDAAMHRLNVAQYTLDVKTSQLIDRVSRLASKVSETEEAMDIISRINQENRKEIGRLEGCMKGRQLGHKCFLVFRSYETFSEAGKRCKERGGRMAMPRDRKEQEALGEYTRGFFHPGNWPVWLGISDQRSEGLYLFEDGLRVTFFFWRKHFLSSQPDGGKRENCVAMSSDDGDWWDNDCERRMYFVCEFDI
uniref:C-type lectin domain containing 11A n=2 Tax=Lepisosteus oculatus TaxID=7918 RepID=W5NFC2_LEPOC